MYCRKCGYKLEEGEKFCTNCGNQVTSLKHAELQINRPSSEERQKKHDRWRIRSVVIICTVICIVLAGGTYGVVQTSMAGEYRTLVQDTSGKYGYIDEKCKEIIACQYDAARDFDESGLAAVAKKTDFNGNKKWGIIDSEGEEVVPMIYDNISEYGFSDNGLIAVAQTRNDGGEIDEWGFVNERGEEVVPCQYISAMWEDIFVWNQKGLTTVGKIIGNDDDGEYQFSYGVIDETGDTVIPLEYRDISLVLGDSGLAAVEKQVSIDQYGYSEYSWGYIDMNNNVIIPFIYDWAESFADNNLAMVTNKSDEEGEMGKSGYINILGEEVIPCEYYLHDSGDFASNGLAAAVNFDGESGYINESGEVEIPFIYEYTASFEVDKRAIVGKAVGEDEEGYDITQYGLINEDGEQILACEYDFISNSNTSGYRYVCKSTNDIRKYGVINDRGEFISPIEYDLVRIGRNKVDSTGSSWRYNNCDRILLGEETGRRNGETEYRYTYVDGKGKLVLQLPEQYIDAGVFMKIR